MSAAQREVQKGQPVYIGVQKVGFVWQDVGGLRWAHSFKTKRTAMIAAGDSAEHWVREQFYEESK